ncbi:endonuclease/exonuclease/phosphatase family protein [Mycoplasma marinum]|uniref:Inositol polyphosphate-related phosphatase domain-containing protein n=1 Tax=Mycoplasma marinum TaxID=1937190 RepID=A0A4R0XTT2_9MOLU|nr:endonuclease/exonuclease/phosphatase family protein [Mycoplasma marinum]TCG11926.1 hypothetical protein C4B24_00825 [Mycoplasma marinum]
MKNKIKLAVLTTTFLALPIVAISCGTTTKKEIKSPDKGVISQPTIAPTLDDSKEYKIGFWNVLNDGKDKGFKNKAIAKVIKYTKMTLVGLAEIDDTVAVKTIAEYLSEYTQNPWKAIYTKKKSGASDAGPSVKEDYGFVYRSDLYTPENFENTQTPGQIYSNPITNKMEYQRPPYGVKFKTKKSEFTAVITHLDGPGKNNKRHEKKDHHGNGYQEVWEAQRTKEVMEWFDSLDGKNKNMIFMGDTNIKTSYNNEPFIPLIKSGYKPLLKTGKGFETSLGKTKNKYSNTYDKIFTNIKNAHNGNHYPLYNVFQDKILVESEFRKEIMAARQTQYKNIISSGISDHCPVFADYKFS